MSNKIVIYSIRIADPKLDIRNSKGTIYTETNQILAGNDLGANAAVIDNGPIGACQGSFRPASGPLTKESSISLTVDFGTLEPASDTTWSISASDLATGQTVVAATPSSSGSKPRMSITVQFKPGYAKPNAPWGYAGDVLWEVKPGNGPAMSETTRLELYSLTDALPIFYHGAVDVGFLRVMVLPARLADGQTWTD